MRLVLLPGGCWAALTDGHRAETGGEDTEGEEHDEGVGRGGRQVGEVDKELVKHGDLGVVEADEEECDGGGGEHGQQGAPPACEGKAGGHNTRGGCRTDETLGDGSEEQPGYLQEAPEEEVTVPHGSWSRV